MRTAIHPSAIPNETYLAGHLRDRRVSPLGLGWAKASWHRQQVSSHPPIRLRLICSKETTKDFRHFADYFAGWPSLNLCGKPFFLSRKRLPRNTEIINMHVSPSREKNLQLSAIKRDFCRHVRLQPHENRIVALRDGIIGGRVRAQRIQLGLKTRKSAPIFGPPKDSRGFLIADAES